MSCSAAVVILPREVKQPAEAGIGEQRQRIEFLRLLQFDPGFIEAAHPGQKIAVPLVSGRVVGIQLNRAFEFGFGSRPIPVITLPHQRQRNVRLGQGVIQLHCLHGCRLRVLPNLLRRRVSGLAQKVIRIGQSGVGLGVVGIFLDCLIEIVGGLPESVFCPLVPVEKALQIELVSFGAFGIVFGDLR